MSVPLEPSRSEPQRRLADLRASLVVLHKALIDSERITYEQTFGTIESQHRFLQLLIDDPWFAWLHPLSELVVHIDEVLESEEPPGRATLDAIVAQTRDLLRASEEGDGFPRSYFEALQREPEVVLAHADVVKAMKP